MKKFKLLSAFTNCLMIFGSCHMKAIKDELIDNNIENIFVAYDTSLQNILVSLLSDIKNC